MDINDENILKGGFGKVPTVAKRLTVGKDGTSEKISNMGDKLSNSMNEIPGMDNLKKLSESAGKVATVLETDADGFLGSLSRDLGLTLYVVLNSFLYYPTYFYNLPDLSIEAILPRKNTCKNLIGDELYCKKKLKCLFSECTILDDPYAEEIKQIKGINTNTQQGGGKREYKKLYKKLYDDIKETYIKLHDIKVKKYKLVIKSLNNYIKNINNYFDKKNKKNKINSRKYKLLKGGGSSCINKKAKSKNNCCLNPESFRKCDIYKYPPVVPSWEKGAMIKFRNSVLNTIENKKKKNQSAEDINIVFGRLFDVIDKVILLKKKKNQSGGSNNENKEGEEETKDNNTPEQEEETKENKLTKEEKKQKNKNYVDNILSTEKETVNKLIKQVIRKHIKTLSLLRLIIIFRIAKNIKNINEESNNNVQQGGSNLNKENSELKNKINNSLNTVPKEDIPVYTPWPFGHELLNPFKSDKDQTLKYIKCLKVQLNLEKDINNECLDCPNCSIGTVASDIWGSILEDLLLNSKPKLYRINSQIDTLYDLLININKKKNKELNNDNRIKRSYLVKRFEFKDSYNHYLKHLLSMGISMFDLNITDLSEETIKDSLLGIPDIIIDKKVFELYKEEEEGESMLDKIIQIYNKVEKYGDIEDILQDEYYSRLYEDVNHVKFSKKFNTTTFMNLIKKKCLENYYFFYGKEIIPYFSSNKINYDMLRNFILYIKEYNYYDAKRVKNNSEYSENIITFNKLIQKLLEKEDKRTIASIVNYLYKDIIIKLINDEIENKIKLEKDMTREIENLSTILEYLEKSKEVTKVTNDINKRTMTSEDYKKIVSDNKNYKELKEYGIEEDDIECILDKKKGILTGFKNLSLLEY